ncbi:MAG: tetratricopeptide repeat protein [Cyanobacteria bacterium P01_A01_bin.17]
MSQCINIHCLHQNSEEATHCSLCGSQLVIGKQFRAIALLSDRTNIFTPREAKTFDAVNIHTQEKIILRLIQSDDPSLTIPLLESVLALRQVHSLNIEPGIMQLADPKGYFTWQVLPEEPESHFMATKKVEGTPLNEWMEQNASINEELASTWLKQLIRSADALHREGFVHQDIKPSNIIVRSSDQQLVLIDLGAIRYIDPRRSVNTSIQQGIEHYPVIGTPGYQAPEQAEGKPSQASDYYAIGCTLIHLLTGTHPADLPSSDSGAISWKEHRSSEEATPTAISEPFADLIDRLTHPNHLYRPLTARDIIEYIDNLPAATQPTTAQRRYRLNARTAKLAALILLGLCLPFAAGIGTAFSAFQNRTEANRLVSEANQLISSGAPAQAIPALEQAVERLPQSADIRATLGLAYALDGNTLSAIDSFESALTLEPDSSIIQFNLANVYENENPQLAIEYYQAATREGSIVRDDATNNLARLYILTDDLQKASELLEGQALPEDSLTRATILKNLGWLQFEQGNFDLALGSLSQSIEINPTRPDAYCLSALIQQQRGEDNVDDRITCLSLPAPSSKPELQRWKQQIL